MDVDDMEEIEPHDRQKNVSIMNRENLLKELNVQKKKVCDAENQKMKRESLLREIASKNKEILCAKKAKQNLKLLSSGEHDSEDPLYKEKMNKLCEQLMVYNQIIKNAQNEIELKETTLNEMNDKSIKINKNNPEIENDEKGNYNFKRKPGKSIAMLGKQKRELMQKLRATEEGKHKHRLDERNRIKLMTVLTTRSQISTEKHFFSPLGRIVGLLRVQPQ